LYQRFKKFTKQKKGDEFVYTTPFAIFEDMNKKRGLQNSYALNSYSLVHLPVSFVGLSCLGLAKFVEGEILE
jgi:hypothetical protein